MRFSNNFQTKSGVWTSTLWCSRLLFLVFFLLKQLPGLVRSPSSLNCLCSNVSSDNHQWFVTFSFLYSNIKYLVSLCIQSNLIVVQNTLEKPHVVRFQFTSSSLFSSNRLAFRPSTSFKSESAFSNATFSTAYSLDMLSMSWYLFGRLNRSYYKTFCSYWWRYIHICR